MSDKRLAHLQMVQGVINHLAQNSFAYKGWTVVLMSAVFVLATKVDKDFYFLFAAFPIIVFWFLDAYYLWQERIFRNVYDVVRVKADDDIDFSMNPYQKGMKEITVWERDEKKISYFDTFLSNTIRYLYGPLLSLALVVWLSTIFDRCTA